MIKLCSLFSGSSGNSIFFSSGSTNILLDAGGSGKKITTSLDMLGVFPENIDAILVSHEHIDHIRGVRILSKKFDIPVYANESTWQAMVGQDEGISLKNKKTFNAGQKFCIKDIYIKPFSIPHDAAEPVGFNIYAGTHKISTATDIGHINTELLEHVDKSDILFIESNHDIEMLKCGPYPFELKRRIMSDSGHLSNEGAAEIVAYTAKRGTTKFILGHLSRENNFPELAYQTTCNILNKNGICVGEDILLSVAERNSMSSIAQV